MDEKTNEAFCKLIDELIDAREELEELRVAQSKLQSLTDVILNHTKLNYSGTDLRLEDEEIILGFIEAFFPVKYVKRKVYLLNEREIEERDRKEKEEGKV